MPRNRWIYCIAPCHVYCWVCVYGLAIERIYRGRSRATVVPDRPVQLCPVGYSLMLLCCCCCYFNTCCCHICWWTNERSCCSCPVLSLRSNWLQLLDRRRKSSSVSCWLKKSLKSSKRNPVLLQKMVNQRYTYYPHSHYPLYAIIVSIHSHTLINWPPLLVVQSVVPFSVWFARMEILI